MSANSQAAGNNNLQVNITVTNSWQTATFYAMNAYDKSAAFNLVFVVFGFVVSVGQSCAFGLIQGAGGTGTEDRVDFFRYRADTGFVGIQNSVYTGTGSWAFASLGQSGTTVQLHAGTESGALATYSATANFSATDLLIEYIAGADGGAQYSNMLVRGCRSWNTTSLFDVTESARVRDASDFTPVVRTSEVFSDLPLVNGTNPEVARTGTNWQLFGAFTTGGSDPVPRPGAPPGILSGSSRDLLTGRLPHLRMAPSDAEVRAILRREKQRAWGARFAADIKRSAERASMTRAAFSFLSA